MDLLALSIGGSLCNREGASEKHIEDAKVEGLANEKSAVLTASAGPIVYEPWPYHRDCFFYRTSRMPRSQSHNQTFARLLSRGGSG